MTLDRPVLRRPGAARFIEELRLGSVSPAAPRSNWATRRRERGHGAGGDLFLPTCRAQGVSVGFYGAVPGRKAVGAKRRNVEAVTDYADNRHFIRLHRDVALPPEVCEAVRRHLTAGRWQEAKQITLEHAPADSHEEIELFFDSTAERLAADPEGAASSASRMASY
jgi:hypothetical protein